MFYNSRRLHLKLDYQRPNTFEAQAAGLNHGGTAGMDRITIGLWRTNMKEDFCVNSGGALLFTQVTIIHKTLFFHWPF